jgi:hypothetical protein
MLRRRRSRRTRRGVNRGRRGSCAIVPHRFRVGVARPLGGIPDQLGSGLFSGPLMKYLMTRSVRSSICCSEKSRPIGRLEPSQGTIASTANHLAGAAIQVLGDQPLFSKTPVIYPIFKASKVTLAFRREKTGNCGSFRPDGTTRRRSCLARCWSCAEAQGVAARILAPRQGKR